MKKLLLGMTLVSLMFASCDRTESNQTVDQKVSKEQEQSLKDMQRQVGMPGIVNFQEKKELKAIYEARDNEKLITYAYLYNEMSGKLVYFGKCIGYGFPYATQYSNPERVAKYDETPERGNVTLPQAEPNGLYMPASSEGTWLMMVDSSGTPHPVYVEPRVIVSPFKLL